MTFGLFVELPRDHWVIEYTPKLSETFKENCKSLATSRKMDENYIKMKEFDLNHYLK